jgi:Fur family ferric uptake transcriptional regulator
MQLYLEILKENGYKLTENRISILKLLVSSNKPLTLKEIQQQSNNIDFTTVYRVINLFNELKIVNQLTFFDKQQYYEILKDEHHHHVICQKCGKIDRIDLCVSNKVSQLTNYTITNHNMEFEGICPECK